MRQEKDIAVLLLGAGVGSYAACRAFYSDYGIRPSVMDEAPDSLFFHSAYASGIRIPHLSSMPPSLFYRVMEDYIGDAEKKGARRFFLLPAADWAQAVAEKQEEALSRLFLLPYRGLSFLPAPCPLPDGKPTGALAVFLDGEGGAVPVYAATPVGPDGCAGGVYLTMPAPSGLAETVETMRRCGAAGIFYADVYGAGKTARTGPFTANLSAPSFFADAADISFAELLIRRWIACAPLPTPERTEKGIYRLVSRQALAACVQGSGFEKEVAMLLARGWDIGLFDGKCEKKSPVAVMARAACARACRAKS